MGSGRDKDKIPEAADRVSISGPTAVYPSERHGALGSLIPCPPEREMRLHIFSRYYQVVMGSGRDKDKVPEADRVSIPGKDKELSAA